MEFRDQEHGNMPRTKMERKVSRSHFKHICLDKVPDDVPRRILNFWEDLPGRGIGSRHGTSLCYGAVTWETTVRTLWGLGSAVC